MINFCQQEGRNSAKHHIYMELYERGSPCIFMKTEDKHNLRDY